MAGPVPDPDRGRDEAAAIDLSKADGIDLTPLLDLLVDNHDVLKVFPCRRAGWRIIYNLTGKTPHPDSTPRSQPWH